MKSIQRITQLSTCLYEELLKLWDGAGISNSARSDSFEAITNSLKHGGVILIACQDEIVQGSAWLTHDYRRLYIHHMAVLPEVQNTGIGTLLLEEAISLARSLGYQAKLEVHADNISARHLYAKYGFTELTGYLTMIKRDI
jgi:ribosomal protein S18 acetylase RimI-like enzyme